MAIKSMSWIVSAVMAIASMALLIMGRDTEAPLWLICGALWAIAATLDDRLPRK